MINHKSLPYIASIIFTTLLLPSLALAHARWVLDSVTPPRNESTGLKSEPCGGIARTARSTIFSAGQTIVLEFEETINHPGHYRIAFSPADDLNFDSNVLVDNILDTTNTGRYTQQVTIPMNVCNACTLQLIQVMTTNPTPAPTDYYYSCSDIQITSSGDSTPPLTVNSLSAVPGDSQATLNWTNPVDDFYQVVVLRDVSPVLDSPVNGVIYANGNTINSAQVVYVGKGNGFTATSLGNDVPYYFKVFAQNPRKNYAGGVEVSVIPMAGAGGGNTGNSPGNPGSSADSGGGSWSITMLLLPLLIRRLATNKLFNRT